MPAQTSANSGQMKLSLDSERRIFGVSELNAAVQNLFASEFRSIWVTGEISALRAAPSGHYYFCLKDNQSQVKCALFKGAARFVRFKPQDGLAVIVRGNLEVYEARGEYQLIVELLEPQGAGALQLAFEQLKKRLAGEGLFEAGRKRPLPVMPARIGLVTSPAGAVIRDMLHVLERRFPGLHIRLFPAQVQGEGSIEQVCRALRYFSETSWADVVILARGGGSLEDLWTFNEEAVARAIAASKVPVISAIGHETDFTIADFVADVRAPTPSAAAELVVCTRESIMQQLEESRAKAIQALRYRLLMCSRNLEQRGTARASAVLHRAIAKQMQRVDDLDFQMQRGARRHLETGRRRLSDLGRRLEATDLRLRFARNRRSLEAANTRLVQCMRDRLARVQRRQESSFDHLRQLSPLAVLARGYALVEDAQHRLLRSSRDTAPGQPISIRLHQGGLDAVISATRED